MADPVIPFDYYERQRRQTRAATAPDPVAATLANMRASDARQTILESGAPDEVARVTRVARAAGENPAEVDGNTEAYEKALTAKRFAEIAERQPALGRWAANNPRGAAAAADDTDSLGILGSAWDILKNAPQRIVGAGLIGGVQQGAVATWNQIERLTDVVSAPVYAGMAALAQATGSPILDPSRLLEARAKTRRQNYDAAAARSEALAKGAKGKSYITEGILAGTENIPLSLIAALTGNPTVAAGLIGTVTSAQSYEEATRKGLRGGTAATYAVSQGLTEGITERIPLGTLVDLIARKTPWGKAFVRELGQEMTGEQISTLVQDFTDWAYLPDNRSKSFKDYVSDRPEAALQTALGVVGGAGGTVSIVGAMQRAADATAKVSTRVVDARQARAERSFLDQAAKAADGSKLKQRDPEAFRELIREHAQDEGAASVFIPGSAIRSFQQSDGYDADVDPFDPTAWAEAEATGGDVVMPIEDFLTDIVGTPAWDAIKDDVRLTQGGLSSREAQEFEAAMDEVIGQTMDEISRQERSEAGQRSVREALVDRLTGMFGQSYTAPVARQYAEVAVQRAQTRAARLGVDLRGDEFDNLDVKQVLPEGVAEAVQADRLDLVINAMRQGKSADYGVGPSLLEFIRQRGGVNDTGGDLASMGVPKRFLRDFDPRQGTFGGISGAGDFGLDNTLQAAISAGYFPDLANAENEAGPSTIDTQRLLDAIAEEVAGRPSFAEVRTDDVRAAADELRQMLEEAGYSPSEMTDAEVRAAVDEMASEPSAGGYQQEARGQISFDSGKTLIELFQGRNLSTALHEMGHMWLEELRFDASLPDAPEQVKADWQAVQQWFARSGHAPDESGAISVEAHELFARGIETYFMEGKAPTSALTRIFENVRQWMISIYKTVEALRAPITPEIREVFDRMLATDEEIAGARERQGIQALFKDAASVGMSEAEFAAYQAQADAARDASHAKLLDKAMRAIRRRETERYRESRKAVRAEQVERIDASPLYRALAAMRSDRISKDWIVDRMGLDALDLLPKRVPPVFVDGGVNPETIAEMAGYRSATEMIEALIGAERVHRQAKEGGDQRSMRERAIETATDEEMNRRYGDPLNDGSIEREALAAVESDLQGEVIASEIRVLGRNSGQSPTPYRIARQWARDKVRSGKWVNEISPGAIQRHARNAAKAGRLAEDALAKGDQAEAYRQKQFQMLNNALVAEAKAAADEVDAAVKRMDKVARATTRKSVDQDYLEQAQALLEAVDLRRRSQVYEKRKGRFAAWAASREAEGYDVVVPDTFEVTLGQTNWSQLPAETILTLDETVKQIMHLGRLKQTLLDNQEEREWAEIEAEAVEGAGNIKGKPPADLASPGFWQSLGTGVARFDAALLKMETVFDWLDGGNSNGVFNRTAFRPIAEAQAREQDMLKDYYAQTRAHFEAVPANIRERWSDRITTPFMDVHTERTMVVNRHQLVAMALNVGNEGNLQRLADGYRVSPEGLISYLDETLTAAEWAFVQNVWDTIDTLWPQIEGLERRVNGIAPEKIAAREFTLADGTRMKGGYYPAVYDSTRDYKAEENRGKESDLLEGGYIRATTRASSTKERAEQVKRPILLDLGVINRHLGEVIHDITHREAVMQANRFLTSERVRRAVDGALGREIGQQFRPWVKHVANSWASDRAGNEGMAKIIRRARTNATMVGMGFRATTIISQVSGYANSMEVVGIGAMAKAMSQYYRNPVAIGREVLAKSDEVRQRMDTMDRDIGAEIRRLSATNPASRFLAKVNDGKQFAFHFIGLMDRFVSIPTWLAGYNIALEQGLSEQDAIYAGDKAVRSSQGAGGAKDLAAVQRGTGKLGEAGKLLTMFYSFLSMQYQRERTLARDVMGLDHRTVRAAPKLMARAALMFVVGPMLTEVLRGAAGSAAGPEDDEWWAQWFARKLLSNALAPIPIVRDMFEPAWNKAIKGRFSTATITPVQRAYDSIVNVFGDVGRIARGEETKHATKDVLEAVGYTTGLVPGQVASATQFIVDWASGDVDPDGPAQVLEGLSTGKIKDD